MRLKVHVNLRKNQCSKKLTFSISISIWATFDVASNQPGSRYVSLGACPVVQFLNCVVFLAQTKPPSTSTWDRTSIIELLTANESRADCSPIEIDLIILELRALRWWLAACPSWPPRGLSVKQKASPSSCSSCYGGLLVNSHFFFIFSFFASCGLLLGFARLSRLPYPDRTWQFVETCN